jgi:membrane associated rhomboid family serine protease
MLPLYDKNRIKKGVPFGTIFLILANTFIFLLACKYSSFAFSFFSFSFENLWNGMFFTIFTSMFLHANVWHLLGNMWFLWVFGSNLELKLGTRRFIIYYLVCGIAGAIFFGLSSTGLVLGASGAISGLLGGYLVLFPKNKIKALFPPFFIYIFIWFLFQLFSIGINTGPIAYWSHIGGFVAGIFLIKKVRKL